MERSKLYRRLNNVVSGILVICAVLVTAVVVKREFFDAPRPQPQGTSRAPVRIEDWESMTGAGLRMGPGDASVVLVEFADFQCPFCAVAADNLRDIRSRYPADVAVIFRHFPLSSIHPHARAAAIAAECAAAQGRFEAFHDLLFQEQHSIGAVGWTEFAARADVPSITDFEACTKDDRPKERVDEDLRAAIGANLTGTPSVIIDGLLIPGTPSVDTLEAYIRRALEGDT